MSEFPAIFHSEFDSINTNLEKKELVKNEAAIEKMRQAAHIADMGFKMASQMLKPGENGEEIRQSILNAINPLTPGDHTRVRLISGPKINFHTPTSDASARMEIGEMAFLEITGKYQDIFFSSARVFPVGNQSAGHIKFLNQLVEAFEWMNQSLKPEKERAFYLAESRGGAIAPYGHGIGNNLFEPPFIQPKKSYILQSGNVLCLAPMVQYPEYGVAYIKEMILISEKGSQRLNEFPITTW